MSFLDEAVISDSVIKSPYFGILAGPPGAGKTWLCRFAPKPFYIALEEGVNKLNVGKFTDKTGNLLMPSNLDDFWAAIKYFLKGQHDYRTIVIDSARIVQQLMITDIIKNNPTETKGKQEVKVESILDYNFGAGVEKLKVQFEKLLAGIKLLNKNGMNVILIAHTHEKNTQDLHGNEFKKTKMELMEWGNTSIPNLLFSASTWTYIIRSEVKTKQVKAFIGTKQIAGEGRPEIVVYTRSGNGFDAKVWTANIDNVPDYYIIDMYNDDSSKIIFEDLEK